MSARVLLVEDEPDIRLIARAALMRAGFVVTTATNGLEALSAVAADRPDLIIMDWMMPELDGSDACARLKADPATQQIPVLFLTARSDGAAMRDAWRLAPWGALRNRSTHWHWATRSERYGNSQVGGPLTRWAHDRVPDYRSAADLRPEECRRARGPVGPHRHPRMANRKRGSDARATGVAGDAVRHGARVRDCWRRAAIRSIPARRSGRYRRHVRRRDRAALADPGSAARRPRPGLSFRGEHIRRSRRRSARAHGAQHGSLLRAGRDGVVPAPGWRPRAHVGGDRTAGIGNRRAGARGAGGIRSQPGTSIWLGTIDTDGHACGHRVCACRPRNRRQWMA